MTTSEWLILINFMWAILGFGLFIDISAYEDRYFQTANYDATELRPFFRGEKVALGRAGFKDFLWMNRLSTRQQEIILAYAHNHPDAHVQDLLTLPSIKAKTVEKIEKYFY